MNQSSIKPGKVFIVGAGPGGPDLLTLKALKSIQMADLILYDHLVDEGIRGLFPAGVPAFYVGKKCGAHSIAQADLNRLLVRKAKQGKIVCRVKGGDPFVFGRGGEELAALRKAGVDAEVVPGITAASGCTSAAGIPLTHRGIAQGCTLVTAEGEVDRDLNWAALVSLGHTLVFYMGVGKAGWISDGLMGAGMNPETPAAVIENGCRAQQRSFSGCVAELSDLVRMNGVQTPAVIVVGHTVALAQELTSKPVPRKTVNLLGRSVNTVTPRMTA